MQFLFAHLPVIPSLVFSGTIVHLGRCRPLKGVDWCRCENIAFNCVRHIYLFRFQGIVWSRHWWRRVKGTPCLAALFPLISLSPPLLSLSLFRINTQPALWMPLTYGVSQFREGSRTIRPSRWSFSLIATLITRGKISVFRCYLSRPVADTLDDRQS